MIGIDITTISRFQDIPEVVFKKFLHPAEIKSLQALKNSQKSVFLASHWAIKEALCKSNNDLVSFNKIHLLKVNRQYTYKNYAISLSHEKDLIVAFAFNREKICQLD